LKTTREKNSNVFSGQAQEKIDFTVSSKNVNKIINILRSSMYKEPSRAVVREILANALDIHKQTGTSKKIDVILPSRKNNNNWIVRDYGTGLSPSEIRTIYTSFGESTKDQSDEAIGGFGVGCKSPFSYTDSYMVNSYYQGKKYQYLMSIADDNSSECRLVLTSDTEEPNGLEVKVPISVDDVRRFSALTVETLFFWDKKHYRINGDDNLIKTPSPEVSGKNWKKYHTIRDCVPSFAAGSRMFNSKNCVINVGGMPYLLDTNAIASGLKKTEADFINSISEGMHVDLDISQVDLPVNREDLRYTDRTKNNLLRIFREIKKTYLSNIQSQVTSAKSLTEALNVFYSRSKYAQMNCTNNYWGQKLKGIDRITYDALMSSDLKWKGINVSKVCNGYKLNSNYRTQTKDIENPNRAKLFYSYGGINASSDWVETINGNKTITWNLPKMGSETPDNVKERQTLHVYQDYETKSFPPNTKQEIYKWAEQNGYRYVQFILTNKQESWETFLKENPVLNEMTDVIHRASVIAPKTKVKRNNSQKRSITGKGDDRVIEVETFVTDGPIDLEDESTHRCHASWVTNCRSGVLVDFKTERHSIAELKKMSKDKKYVGYFVKTKKSENNEFFDPKTYFAENWSGMWTTLQDRSSYHHKDWPAATQHRKDSGHYFGLIKAINLALIYCGLEKDIIKKDDIVIYGVKPQHEQYIKKIPNIQNPKDFFKETYFKKIKPIFDKTLNKIENDAFDKAATIEPGIFDLSYNKKNTVTALYSLSFGFGKTKEFLSAYPEIKKILENPINEHKQAQASVLGKAVYEFAGKYALLSGIKATFEGYGSVNGRALKEHEYQANVNTKIKEVYDKLVSKKGGSYVYIPDELERVANGAYDCLTYNQWAAIKEYDNKNILSKKGNSVVLEILNAVNGRGAKSILAKYIVDYYEKL